MPLATVIGTGLGMWLGLVQPEWISRLTLKMLTKILFLRWTEVRKMVALGVAGSHLVSKNGLSLRIKLKLWMAKR